MVSSSLVLTGLPRVDGYDLDDTVGYRDLFMLAGVLDWSPHSQASVVTLLFFYACLHDDGTLGAAWSFGRRFPWKCQLAMIDPGCSRLKQRHNLGK